MKFSSLAPYQEFVDDRAFLAWGVGPHSDSPWRSYRRLERRSQIERLKYLPLCGAHRGPAWAGCGKARPNGCFLHLRVVSDLMGWPLVKKGDRIAGLSVAVRIKGSRGERSFSDASWKSIALVCCVVRLFLLFTLGPST